MFSEILNKRQQAVIARQPARGGFAFASTSFFLLGEEGVHALLSVSPTAERFAFGAAPSLSREAAASIILILALLLAGFAVFDFLGFGGNRPQPPPDPVSDASGVPVTISPRLAPTPISIRAS